MMEDSVIRSDMERLNGAPSAPCLFQKKWGGSNETSGFETKKEVWVFFSFIPPPHRNTMWTFFCKMLCVLKSLLAFKGRQDKITEEKFDCCWTHEHIWPQMSWETASEVGQHLNERRPCVPPLLLSSSPGIQLWPLLAAGSQISWMCGVWSSTAIPIFCLISWAVFQSLHFCNWGYFHQKQKFVGWFQLRIIFLPEDLWFGFFLSPQHFWMKNTKMCLTWYFCKCQRHTLSETDWLAFYSWERQKSKFQAEYKIYKWEVFCFWSDGMLRYIRGAGRKIVCFPCLLKVLVKYLVINGCPPWFRSKRCLQSTKFSQLLFLW